MRRILAKILTATIFLLAYSCDRLDEIDSRLEILEEKVSTLEDATEALQTLYAEGKVINNITPTEEGYQITFSDNSKLNISDGITPLLLIDQDNYCGIVPSNTHQN